VQTVFALSVVFHGTSFGDSTTGGLPPNSIESADLRWHTDYLAAYSIAKREARMLLVNFVPTGGDGVRVQRDLEAWIERDAALRTRLANLTLVRLPVDAEINEGGQRIRLTSHAAFDQLIGGAGIAMIDLVNPAESFYGRVVTVLPFANGKYYRWQNGHVNAALDLPAGTLSQRTMVWAVRAHHESPESTTGVHHPVLSRAAEEQAAYQAELGEQGHHRWETRFHRICSAASANGASEVVAESWPGENLVDACIDCVISWRQSPGHWQAVKKRHRLFGYDIRRGRNGIWYGTGIFAN
jgi:hypothetical protein